MTTAEPAPPRARPQRMPGAPEEATLDRPRAPNTPTRRSGSAGFRRDIEGLRAVAILTVLAYHAGLPVAAGYVGVDVFFVISGFLITGLLVAELDRTGSISWIRFVGRRIRRLLPAAVLVLVLTCVVSWFVVPGLRRRDVGVDVAAAATYVVNWVFAGRETDYLASDALPSPVQHFWSLAVEEQFYVVWPLLLVALARIVRRPSRRLVGSTLGAVVAASFAWSVEFSHASPAPAFFVTTTRVWELGVGALLAVGLAGRPRPAVPARGSAAVGWLALIVLLAVAAWLPTGVDWPGAWALLATGPTALLIWVGWQGPASGPVRLLGAAPMVAVGGLSYSLYLWHWPVLVLGGWTAGALGAGPLPPWGPLLLALVSFVPAWLSWRFVESPIHHGTWLRNRPRAVLAAGLALSGVAVLAALPLLAVRSPFVTTPPGGSQPPRSALGAGALEPGRPLPVVDDPGWVTPDPLLAGGDRPAADVDRCQVDRTATEPVACTFGDPQGTTTVALAGDSKAMQWLPALEEEARIRGWRIVTYGKSSCVWSAAPAALVGAGYPECDAWNAAVSAALEADPPDAVVTSGAAVSAWTAHGTAREPLVRGYADRWSAVAGGGVPVVVVGDSPLSPDDLDVCAARHPTTLTRCTFDATPAVAGSGLGVQREAVSEAAARSTGAPVRLLDLTPQICPDGRCPVAIGHVAVHRPGDHLTATYARTLAPRVTAAVEDVLRR